MTLRTWPASISTPRPLPSTPMLLETTVRSVTPGIAHGLDQVGRDAAQAEPADGEGHAVPQDLVQGGGGAGFQFGHGISSLSRWHAMVSTLWTVNL